MERIYLSLSPRTYYFLVSVVPRSEGPNLAGRALCWSESSYYSLSSRLAFKEIPINYQEVHLSLKTACRIAPIYAIPGAEQSKHRNLLPLV